MGVLALPALADHNGAAISIEVGECGETTLEATIVDPAGTHKASGMRLVVSVEGGDTEFTDSIPADGNAVSITVGPFEGATTISWRVFGGGERSYDQPLWNGYGEADFSAAITAYAADVGGFSWVVAGPDDPNPFTTWHEFDVEGCLVLMESCKDGGWAALGFRNQGLCISYVNTGKDSR
jgi:hypothetical protein